MVRLIAYIYKFSPESLDAMYVDDLGFWMDGLPDVAKFMGVM
jgi:hypothetical protein